MAKSKKKDKHTKRAEKDVASVSEIGLAYDALLEMVRDEEAQARLARLLVSERAYDHQGEPGRVTKRGARDLVEWMLLMLQGTDCEEMRKDVVASRADDYRWEEESN